MQRNGTVARASAARARAQGKGDPDGGPRLRPSSGQGMAPSANHKGGGQIEDAAATPLNALPHVMTATRSGKHQVRRPTDHFERLLEEACPNHAYPLSTSSWIAV
jgi:hypothetical protein